MKDKIKTIYLHIIVITISVVAFMFGNDIGSGTMPKIKDPSSPILVLFRDLMTGVFFAYFPYIILGWTKNQDLLQFMHVWFGFCFMRMQSFLHKKL